MPIAFFVSSAGDTDLALETAKVLRKYGKKTVFIPLTKNAEDRVAAAAKLAAIEIHFLYDLIHLNPELKRIQRCTNKQIQRVLHFLQQKKFTQIYVGVPSERNQEVAFQIAEHVKHIPVLLASEFMFKPHPEHSIWQHLPKLHNNPKLQWSVPLKKAQAHFALNDDQAHINGHVSIDRALQPIVANADSTKQALHLSADQDLVFMSSSTQPTHCDVDFLTTILQELPKHPQIHLCLGLHPNISDLDSYLQAITDVYLSFGSPRRFQIIFPPTWRNKLRYPEKSVDNNLYDSLFVLAEISGSQASAAANRGVLQSVPGALLNEAAVRGKAVYTHFSQDEEPCLPKDLFAQSPAVFFTTKPLVACDKSKLNVPKQTAGEVCAETLLRM